MDLRAFHTLSSGLYVLSTVSGRTYAGCIVNTVTQVTAEPAQLMAAVHKQNHTAQAIQASGKFAVTSLAQDAPMDLIAAFGFHSSVDTDKFSGVLYGFDRLGLPYAAQNACAHFACEVAQVIDAGTHLLFIGRVAEAQELSDRSPLTYEHYRLVKKGSTPPKSPSYLPDVPADRQTWRCTVCGYLYEREALPESYVCPICRKGREFFEKL